MTYHADIVCGFPPSRMAGSKLLEVNMKKTQFVIGLSALILLAILLSLPDTPLTYEDVESTIEQQIASGSVSASDPHVEISEDQVYIYIKEMSYSELDMYSDIGTVLGCYAEIVKEFPDVGDLQCDIVSRDERHITTFTCQKSWVKNTDFSRDEEKEFLVDRVLGTVENIPYSSNFYQ